MEMGVGEKGAQLMKTHWRGLTTVPLRHGIPKKDVSVAGSLSSTVTGTRIGLNSLR